MRQRRIDNNEYFVCLYTKRKQLEDILIDLYWNNGDDADFIRVENQLKHINNRIDLGEVYEVLF